MSNTFPIDWKDIPPEERKQLQILWYFDGVLIDVGNLSQGERCSPDLRTRYGLLDTPDTTHTISYYIVASSDGSAAWRPIEYTDVGPNDGYFKVSSWKLSMSYSQSRSRTPVEQSTDRKKGERWQTIMASHSCTFRVGPDKKALKIDPPAGSISITNIVNPDGTSPSPTGPSGPAGPGPSGNCYYETCCDPSEFSYYGAGCRARRAEIAADGGICCGGQSPTGPQGPLGPFVPTPSVKPF